MRNTLLLGQTLLFAIILLQVQSSSVCPIFKHYTELVGFEVQQNLLIDNTNLMVILSFSSSNPEMQMLQIIDLTGFRILKETSGTYRIMKLVYDPYFERLIGIASTQFMLGLFSLESLELLRWINPMNDYILDIAIYQNRLAIATKRHIHFFGLEEFLLENSITIDETITVTTSTFSIIDIEFIKYNSKQFLVVANLDNILLYNVTSSTKNLVVLEKISEFVSSASLNTYNSSYSQTFNYWQMGLLGTERPILLVTYQKTIFFIDLSLTPQESNNYGVVQILEPQESLVTQYVVVQENNAFKVVVANQLLFLKTYTVEVTSSSVALTLQSSVNITCLSNNKLMKISSTSQEFICNQTNFNYQGFSTSLSFRFLRLQKMPFNDKFLIQIGESVRLADSALTTTNYLLYPQVLRIGGFIEDEDDNEYNRILYGAGKFVVQRENSVIDIFFFKNGLLVSEESVSVEQSAQIQITTTFNGLQILDDRYVAFSYTSRPTQGGGGGGGGGGPPPQASQFQGFALYDLLLKNFSTYSLLHSNTTSESAVAFTVDTHRYLCQDVEREPNYFWICFDYSTLQLTSLTKNASNTIPYNTSAKNHGCVFSSKSNFLYCYTAQFFFVYNVSNNFALIQQGASKI